MLRPCRAAGGAEASRWAATRCRSLRVPNGSPRVGAESFGIDADAGHPVVGSDPLAEGHHFNAVNRRESLFVTCVNRLASVDASVQSRATAHARGPPGDCSACSCSRAPRVRSVRRVPVPGWRGIEPASTQVARVGDTNMPPPLEVMILFPLNENVAQSPNDPAGRPRKLAPSASAASSTNGISSSSQAAVKTS